MTLLCAGPRARMCKCVAHYVEISMPSDITEFDTFIHDIKLKIDFVIIFFRFFRIK